MRRIKPDIIFSKGGFVSVPVVLAAGHKHIPVIIHESDMTPGLANRIAIKRLQRYAVIFLKLSSTFLLTRLFLQALLSVRSFYRVISLPDLSFAISQVANQ